MAAEVMVVADALVDGDRRLPPHLATAPPLNQYRGDASPRRHHPRPPLLNQYRGRRVPASTSSTTKP